MISLYKIVRASQVVLVVKNLPANAEEIKDVDLIPELLRSTGGGPSNSLQYSCLENPMDRRAWKLIVHGVTKSWTRLKWLSTHKMVIFFFNTIVTFNIPGRDNSSILNFTLCINTVSVGRTRVQTLIIQKTKNFNFFVFFKKLL